MKRTFWLLSLASLAMSSATASDAVTIEPGQWAMEMRIEMPMLPQPQERSYTECIEEAELNPEDFNTDENSPCQISEVERSGNTIRWSIECPASSSSGHWSFTSHGDSLEGEGAMHVNMGGQIMEMKMSWTGTRIGDCEG